MQSGTPREVFHRPANRFVAQFIGDADFIPARLSPEGSHVRTELGDAAFLGGTEPSINDYDLMVRPDDLAVEPSPDGDAVITDRVFTGQLYLYHVKTDSELTCRAQATHVNALEVGARVTVSVTAGHPLPVFPRVSNDTPEFG